jgi:anti-anti-sigma regulatory factor
VLPQCKEELAAALASRSGVVVEVETVQRVGTPAIQLLLAAAREFSADTQSFALRAPSPALMAAFEDLGLGDEARSWSVA